MIRIMLWAYDRWRMDRAFCFCFCFCTEVTVIELPYRISGNVNVTVTVTGLHGCSTVPRRTSRRPDSRLIAIWHLEWHDVVVYLIRLIHFHFSISSHFLFPTSFMWNKHTPYIIAHQDQNTNRHAWFLSIISPVHGEREGATSKGLSGLAWPWCSPYTPTILGMTSLWVHSQIADRNRQIYTPRTLYRMR